MNQVADRQGVQQTFLPFDQALALADRCRQEGRLGEAETLCRRIIEAQPNTPEAEHMLGLIAHQNGKLAEAAEHVRRAVELAPEVALFHANLGELLRQGGRPRLAVQEARLALAIDPKMATALSNLGVALFELKEFEEAVEAHREAIAAQSDFAEAHSNLGNALHALRRYDEAIAAYRRALELKPGYVDAMANLGTALHHNGEFEDGAAVMRHAIALSPHHANARAGLGLLLLMRGDLGEGWDEYEWRLRSSERTGPHFPERPWQGESLAGKHVYVQAEQGFGDTLHFARYLPLLARRAGRVTLRAHQQLVTLLRASLPEIAILGDRGDPGPFDCDMALLSLPHMFGTRLETIPAGVPYLRASEEAARRWRESVAKMTGLKVGFAWAGNPEHANNARRSLDLAILEPLFAVPGTSFASLQVGKQRADLRKRKRGRPAVDDLSPRLFDFEQTAGAITGLDLVITVDTALAHLSGALGKPTWVLVPFVADWRWLLERQDSPWYPTLRLFRQRPGEDWGEIVTRMAGELERVARGDHAPLTPFRAEGERRAARAAAIIAAQQERTASAPAPEPALTPGQALVLAEQKRRHNFLGDAAKLAQEAVAAQPDNAEAQHTLGLIAYQSGKLAEAIEHVRQAATLRPDVAFYHANLGEMCRLAGQIDDAIAAGRRAIELDPANAGALSNLAIALFDQGKYAEALPYHERAIALRPDFAQAHSNHGNALQRLKRFSEAEPCYRRAVELQPEFADGWNNLGTCLREMGRLDEAERAYRKALDLQPNNPDTFDNLALALKDLNRLDEAAELMRRALVIDTARDSFHTHYAAILLDQEQFDEAAEALHRALALNPNSHDAINQMGRVAFERGELDDAFLHYRRALELKPDLADAYNNMGNVLKELGRLQEAQNAYLEAIRLDPSTTATYLNLADSKTFTPGDSFLRAMEGLAAGNPTRTDRIQLGFALGKAYADLKDHRRSFAHLSEANALKRATVAYDEKAAFAFFDRIEAVFTPALMRAKSGSGEASPRPIFVIGMPRSGTTLVEQILASHPMVRGAGELKTLNDIVGTVAGDDSRPRAYPAFVPALGAAAIRQIGTRYLDELTKLAPTGERVTDKMPSNYYFVGLIHLALPDAKIIHCVRDPVDTCVSCFSKLFSGEQVHTYDLAELGRYYKRYERLMAHWRRVLPAGTVLDMRYEDVVAGLATEARRLIAYCGLPWDESCLEFHKTERPIRTASASQVRRPIYSSAVGRWRAYADDLGPLLAALGIDGRPTA